MFPRLARRVPEGHGGEGRVKHQKISVQAFGGKRSLFRRGGRPVREPISNESLILAQNQRWRRA